MMRLQVYICMAPEKSCINGISVHSREENSPLWRKLLKFPHPLLGKLLELSSPWALTVQP